MGISNFSPWGEVNPLFFCAVVILITIIRGKTDFSTLCFMENVVELVPDIGHGRKTKCDPRLIQYSMDRQIKNHPKPFKRNLKVEVRQISNSTSLPVMNVGLHNPLEKHTKKRQESSKNLPDELQSLCETSVGLRS